MFLKIVEKSLRCFVVSCSLPCSKYFMKDQQLPFQNVRWYDNNTACHCRSTSTYFHVLHDRSSHMKMYFKERETSDTKLYLTIPQIWQFWRDNICSMLLPNRFVWMQCDSVWNCKLCGFSYFPLPMWIQACGKITYFYPKKSHCPSAHPTIKLGAWNRGIGIYSSGKQRWIAVAVILHLWGWQITWYLAPVLVCPQSLQEQLHQQKRTIDSDRRHSNRLPGIRLDKLQRASIRWSEKRADSPSLSPLRFTSDKRTWRKGYLHKSQYHLEICSDRSNGNLRPIRCWPQDITCFCL